jgi:hypothetical protein
MHRDDETLDMAVEMATPHLNKRYWVLPTHSESL